MIVGVLLIAIFYVGNKQTRIDTRRYCHHLLTFSPIGDDGLGETSSDRRT
jgi:hypothetical protein